MPHNVSISISTPSACGCCGGAVINTFECRTRAGIQRLCGYQSLDGSAPVKKYRYKNFNLDVMVCDCDGFGMYWGQMLGYFYSQDGCSEDEPEDHLTVNTFYTLADCDRATTFPGTGPIYDFISPSSQNATHEIFSNDNCTNFAYRQNVINGVVNLSNEFTWSDAYNDYLNAYSWSNWAAGNCNAYYQNNYSNYTIAYSECQWRLNGSGYTPSANYNVSVDIFRRVYNTGNYSLYQTVTITNTANAGGYIFASDNVPNDVGFTSYASLNTVAPA